MALCESRGGYRNGPRKQWLGPLIFCLSPAHRFLASVSRTNIYLIICLTMLNDRFLAANYAFSRMLSDLDEEIIGDLLLDKMFHEMSGTIVYTYTIGVSLQSKETN